MRGWIRIRLREQKKEALKVKEESSKKANIMVRWVEKNYNKDNFISEMIRQNKGLQSKCSREDIESIEVIVNKKGRGQYIENWLMLITVNYEYVETMNLIVRVIQINQGRGEGARLLMQRLGEEIEDDIILIQEPFKKAFFLIGISVAGVESNR